MRVFRQLALPPHVQRWVFVAFFIGCGGGLVGVFRWWVTVAADARAFAVPLLLSALFLKMGTYAFLKLTLPLLPDASRSLAPAIVGLAAIGIVLSAVAAFAQTNWNRVLAYASLGHLCLVTLGAFALTPDGLTGSAVHQINHGLSIAALFLLAGLVVERGGQAGIGGGSAVGTSGRASEMLEATKIGEYGGLLNAMPKVAAVWLIMTLSLVGVPKLNGYVGTRLAFEGLWPVSRAWSIVAAGGMILSGVALLWLFSRTMLGELKTPGRSPVEGPPPPRSVGDLAAGAAGRLDWSLAGAAPGESRNIGRARRAAGKPRVRPGGRRLPDATAPFAGRDRFASGHRGCRAVCRRSHVSHAAEAVSAPRLR